MFEHMFEHVCMNHAATVRSLRERITQMQPLRLADETLPTPQELQELLPWHGLRRGSAVTVQGSAQLSLALLSAVSVSGAWCGAVGLRHFGVEAAARLGLSLERFVVVPEPGRHAIAITATLSEVFSAVLLAPPAEARPGEAERLAARLREHGTALIVLGSWPRAESALQVTASRWEGLGRGHGLLDTHELSVRTQDRRGPRQHTVTFRAGRLAQPLSPASLP